MKDLKQSCQTLSVAQQGKAAIAVLAVLAVVAAGVLGFVAGQKSGPEPMGGVNPPKEGPFKVGKGEVQENPVVASVNGSDIKRQDVIDLMNAMPMQMRQVPPEQLYPMALEQAVGNKLADRKSAISGLEKDPLVQKQLWQAKEQIIRANFIEREVNSRITEDLLKEEYDRYVEKFPEVEEVKAAHILVEDEKIAKDIVRKLDKGEDFAELAKEYSKDGSAERGGEIGYFARNEVVAEFADSAFETKPGTYAKKPVKSEFGYHVVRVDEKRMRPPMPFEQIKPYIKQELERTKLQEILDEWKAEAKIERFDINGNPVEPAAEEESAEAAAESAVEGSIEAEVPVPVPAEEAEVPAK